MSAASAQTPAPTTPCGYPPSAHPDAAARVELILARVDEIPTLSPVATRLLAVGRSRDADMKEIIKLIESDPALSTKLVSLCRRADKGLGERITTVKRAVLMLGFDAVRSAALSVCVYEHMRQTDDAHRKELDRELAGSVVDASESGVLAFDRHGFWKHQIAVACASELIAETHPKLRVQSSEAFLAGLLHGIGKLVLQFVLPRAYDSVVRLARKRAAASRQIELQVLGIDHHTAGERIAIHWALPEAVSRVALLYGDSLKVGPQDGADRLVAVVALAKMLCRELHLGWSGDFDAPPRTAPGWAQLGLDSRGPAPMMDRLLTAISERYEILGLGQCGPQRLLLESLAHANSLLIDALRARG